MSIVAGIGYSEVGLAFKAMMAFVLEEKSDVGG
jgi:hypothetical protein